MRALFLGLIAVALGCAWSDRLALAQGRAGELPVPGDATQQPKRAQSASPPGADRTSGETNQQVENTRIEASPLDTILLRDAKGNLVPLVGIPFEEFEQLLRTKKGIAPASPPAYTLENVSLTGKAGAQSADFMLTATVRVRENGWIRVPLHLAGAVIREPMQHQGPGEHFLTYDTTANGYVCWLSGNDAHPHVIRIELSLPIAAAGEEHRLAISLPRATESSLRMVVDSPAVDASLTSGEGIATSRTLESGASEITVAGAAGDMQLAWRSGRKRGGSQLQIDASGEIAVRIHSEHRIAADARLRVRSYGLPLDSFRVRLPPGMELISTASGGGYSLTVVDPEATDRRPKNAAQDQQMVEVRLDKPAASTEVLLRAQREADAATTGWFSPAQFSVIGAIRQRGTIDFAMDGEWQLDWKEDKSVHRTELMPNTTAARLVARYEYFRQPCGLSVKVSARPSRLSVEPIHRVYIETERVRIESLLKYRFRGARAESLSFEMAGWDFDSLTPDGLLDFPLEDAANTGELRVPFRPGAAPPSELELKLIAHRDLPRTAEQLAVEFPRPRADFVVPATILIFAADNVEVTPQYDEIHGLLAESGGSRPLEKEHPSLIFRDLGGDEPARFIAGLRTLQRSTNTTAKAMVRIERQVAHVEQRIEYQVSHEPQREFVLLAPREIASSDSLDVVINGQSSPAKQLLQPLADDDRIIRLQVSTPQPLLGNFAATIRYSLPLAWDRTAAGSLTLPLILPIDEGDGFFSGQQVQFHLVDDMNIEPEQVENEDAVQPVAVRGASNTYSWDAAASFSQWTLVPGRSAAATSTHVSQMWVQTWLAPDVRHERVALRVTSMHERLRLRLPPGVRQSSIQAAVDSERVEPGKGRSERNSPTSAVEISLALKNRAQNSVVEVWYSLDPPPRRLGVWQGELRTVQIPDAEPPRRAYWQLVTSPGEHLIAFPQQLSAEMAWSTDRFRMFRRPILDQRQLESWMKASRQDLLPYTGHEYLFGTVARWPILAVQTARSSAIVGLASASVLLIGLALLYIPALRRPDFMLCAAILLAAGGVVWPDTAIIVGQAGVLGLAILALLGIWNYLSIAAPRRETRTVPASASKSLSASAAQSSVSRRDVGSRLGTTHGAPLVEVRP